MLVVALEGFQAGVIAEVAQVAAVLMALITTAMTGPLFDRFIKAVPTEQPVPDRATGTEPSPLIPR